MEDWPPLVLAIMETSNFTWNFGLEPSYEQAEHVLLLQLSDWCVIERVFTIAAGCCFSRISREMFESATHFENGCKTPQPFECQPTLSMWLIALRQGARYKEENENKA